MRKLPPQVQEYLQKSPYGPFTESEVAHLAARIEQDDILVNIPSDTEGELIERESLVHRAAVEPTPRNIAIGSNAINARAKAKGIHQPFGPLCHCGSPDVYFVVDGPDPTARICDACGAPLSVEQYRNALAIFSLNHQAAQVQARKQAILKLTQEVESGAWDERIRKMVESRE